MKYHVAAALLLAFSAPLLAQQQSPQLEQPGKWAQDYAGRKADPRVRFGTLPNGLRYAIMHNETPTDGVALRMRIGSGSLEERDDEQGLAHFLEHMAFRGSANVPDGEVVHMLQRQGLQFGPDTNAFTAHDETVYMFNFPKADATALDTGLTLFREIGGRLKLDPALIDAERGVVLSEERLRDTPAYRMTKANLGTLLDGTRAIQRWPIGKVEILKTAGHDQLERFYRANYRPDNATIVVVGNVDPAAVEQQIRARFSDWKPAGTSEAIDFGVPSGAKKVGEFVGPGVPDQLSVAWTGPADRRADTDALEREQLIKYLALTVLNERLSDLALKPGSPFVGAQVSQQRSVLHSGSLATIGITTTPDKWQAALDAVTAAQRELLRDGVQPGELKRAVTTLLTQYQNKAETDPTRKSQDIADELVWVVNSDQVATSAAQDLAFAAPILASVTPADVNAAMKQVFTEHGPILFRSARELPAGEPKLAQALQSAFTRPLGAAVLQASISWPYTSFGKPGAIISKSVDAKLGTTLVRFANGTRLLVKPLKYEKDKIAVAVLLGNGRSAIASANAHAIWESQFFPYVGTGKLPLADITRWAEENGKVVNINFQPWTHSFVLSGNTRPADLVSQLQLLDAYARSPGFRPEAYEKVKSIAPMYAAQISGNPNAVYYRTAQALMVGNDPRFRQLPSDSDLANVTRQDLQVLLKRPLAGQADVVIVGNTTVDQAMAAVRGTFGAGSGGAKLARVAARVVMPQGRAEPYVTEHSGRPDQATYGEYFPVPDYFTNPKIDAIADVASAVISTRLVDTVREMLGITYSPQVQAVSSDDLPGEGYFAVTLETPPANFDKFHALLAGQLRDLAAKPVSADELKRAVQPLIETERKQRETNNFWIGKLAQIARDPRIEAKTLTRIERLSAVTAADVQALITQYAVGKQPLIVIARAKASPVPTGAK